MKKLVLIHLFFLGFLGVMAQTLQIENDIYKIAVPNNFTSKPRFYVTHKTGNITRLLVPQIRVAFAKTKPQLVAASADGFGGVIGWEKGGKTEKNIFALPGATVITNKVTAKERCLYFTIKDKQLGEVSLTVNLASGIAAPSLTMAIKANQSGWYSLGFTGLEAIDPVKLDFLYQPLTWSWKRFPAEMGITEEAYATTAATFINTAGFTEGLAAAPEMIPFRYAHSLQWNNAGEPGFWNPFPPDGPKGNSLFGLSLRNPQGQAQPSLFAPLWGGDGSYLKKGATTQFTSNYLLVPGNWQQGTDYLLKNIFQYKSERQNALVSLNQTFDNMLNLAMNDVYGGWVADLKASDYRFDVPNTVKNVSALHALGLALVTGNQDIYQLRALPMMEYVMSREKFLFSIENKPGQAQVPSHFLKGPAVDIGELAGLHLVTNGQTPAFQSEINRLFGKSRKLNMDTETGGGSWQDYLARYQVSKDKNDLQKAVAGAEDYLRQVYDTYSQNFKDSPGLKDKAAYFTTDFTLRIYDLFQLYEETGDKRYLNAALTGAKQLLLWTRSTPLVPDTVITVNKGGKVTGIFPGRRQSNIEGQNPFVKTDVVTAVPEQKVPAWHTSLNGLVPEAANTYAFGPVMLAHHAPWLLRLALVSGDTLLRDAAYNAVIGRYANFPGYYFTSLETNVYQKADYPMHPFSGVKYNAIFYNHVWPHLAMLMDFLISDFYYRSNGKIDFPSVYAPGYAFLTSKVYGSKTGSFMGTTGVQLWLPQHAIQSITPALNHLLGVKDNDLYLALANTSPLAVKQIIRLNPAVISFNTDQLYPVEVLNANGASPEKLTCQNGYIEVEIPANGLVAYKIKGLDAQAALLPKPKESQVKALPKNRFTRETSPDLLWGITTAMVIQTFPHFADFYIFSDRTEKDWQSAVLHYKVGKEEWKVKEDKIYPFEFDIHLPDPKIPIRYKLEATDKNGKVVEAKEAILNN